MVAGEAGPGDSARVQVHDERLATETGLSRILMWVRLGHENSLLSYILAGLGLIQQVGLAGGHHDLLGARVAHLMLCHKNVLIVAANCASERARVHILGRTLLGRGEVRLSASVANCDAVTRATVWHLQVASAV